MKTKFFFIGTVVCFIGLASARADDITLRADSWCPYNCEPDAEKPGFLIEIAKAVLEEHGHKIDYKLMNWARAIEDVKTGAFDAAVGAGVDDAPELIFPSIEQGMQKMCFFVKPESTWTYTGIESLKSIKPAVIKDYSYQKDLDSYIEANPSKVETLAGENAAEKALKMLMSDRVDAYIDDAMVVNQMLEKQGNQSALKVAGCTEPEPIYIAFSPASPKGKEYAKILSEGTQKLRESGKLAEIMKKYGAKDWK